MLILTDTSSRFYCWLSWWVGLDQTQKCGWLPRLSPYLNSKNYPAANCLLCLDFPRACTSIFLDVCEIGWRIRFRSAWRATFYAFYHMKGRHQIGTSQKQTCVISLLSVVEEIGSGFWGLSPFDLCPAGRAIRPLKCVCLPHIINDMEKTWRSH